jgi:chromosome segregation and condensation protein ScpB
MATRATVKFNLPLTPELHDQLREEAERSGKPATAVAREALRTVLGQRKRHQLHAEIKAFASEYAGSDIDLDEDLERAGIESLQTSSMK